MHICCKDCKTYTGNTFRKKLDSISDKKAKAKSKCAECLTHRTA